MQQPESRSASQLPEQFKELQPLVDDGWALRTERERNAKRLSSSMAEIRNVYDSLFPRMDEIVNYLNQCPLDDMPEEARTLLNLTLALAEVSPAVEFYGQPEVVYGFPPSRFLPVDVPHMTPKE
jgi:hypothetical protein